jgi:hypothetical protein
MKREDVKIGMVVHRKGWLSLLHITSKPDSEGTVRVKGPYDYTRQYIRDLRPLTAREKGEGKP